MPEWTPLTQWFGIGRVGWDPIRIQFIVHAEGGLVAEDYGGLHILHAHTVGLGPHNGDGIVILADPIPGEYDGICESLVHVQFAYDIELDQAGLPATRFNPAKTDPGRDRQTR
jgi:hypothetical protein